MLSPSISVLVAMQAEIGEKWAEVATGGKRALERAWPLIQTETHNTRPSL